jgi:hypothetical protein
MRAHTPLSQLPPNKSPITAAERLRAARATAGPPPPSIGSTISRAKAALAKARGESPPPALGAEGQRSPGSPGVIASKPFTVLCSHEPPKPKPPVG